MLVRHVGAAVRQDDWAAPVRRLRLREAQWLDESARSHQQRAGRKHVLMFSFQQVPPWLEIEYSVAAALRLRGHRVDGILCDGLLPRCEMNLGRIDRPPCEVCAGWLARYEDAFGFAFTRLTAFLASEDLARAERDVAATPDEELAALIVDEVNVGRLAARELQRYARGFVFDAPADSAYRHWLVSAVLLVRLAGRLLERECPDIVVMANGRTLPTACLLAVARRRGVDVVTWDTEPTHADGLVFAHNQAAVEIPLDDLWPEAATRPLTSAETKKLAGFLRGWERGENTPFPFNPAPVEDRAAIGAHLGLRVGAPLVVAFTNAAWDMAVVDRDRAFASMFDWLFALVDHAAAHPEIDLVVRAHPAETNVPPDLQSRTPVTTEIRARRGSLPENIKLVDGRSRVSSYVLAEMADIVTVYASRIGLEIAMRGKRPWLAGQMTYRSRGFTRDLTSKQDMLERLAGRVAEDPLSRDEIDLAMRFAYLWFFRYVTRIPLLRPRDGRFVLRTFRDLAPGVHPIIDRLCHALVTGAPFVDLDS